MKGLINGSYVPESTARQLRQYNRMIFDPNGEVSRKLVKLDACVQRCNIRLSDYVSTEDSKSYHSVVKATSEGVIDPEKLLEKVHMQTAYRRGRNTILASLRGVITETDCDIMRIYMEELATAIRKSEWTWPLSRHRRHILSEGVAYREVPDHQEAA